MLPSSTKVIGVDPSPKSHEEFTEHMKQSIDVHETDLAEIFAQFCEKCHYITLKTDQGDKSFEELRDLMESFEDKEKQQHRLFYMALPPKVYVPVSEQLKRCCKDEKVVSRMIVNFSFGYLQKVTSLTGP